MSPRTTAEWVERLSEAGVKIEFKTVVVLPGNDGAYYWDSDKIALTPEASVSTVFHELVHWTGHKSRLKRHNFNPLFNAQANWREEIIAWDAAQALVALDDEDMKFFTKFPPRMYLLGAQYWQGASMTCQSQ